MTTEPHAMIPRKITRTNMHRIGMLVLAWLMLAAVSSPALAQADKSEARDGQMVIITELGSAPTCDAQSAQNTDLATLAHSGTALLEKCVSVAGVLNPGGWMIFANRHDARAYARPDGMEHAQQRLGVYATKELAKTFPVDMSRVVLVGNMGDCDELSHRPGVIMVSGYCHYSNGAYIAVSSFRVDTTGGH